MLSRDNFETECCNDYCNEGKDKGYSELSSCHILSVFTLSVNLILIR